MRRWLPGVLAVLCLGGLGCSNLDDVGRSDLSVSVTWTSAVGVTASANNLVKTSTVGGWNAGAVSVETLDGDGRVEFTTSENTTGKMAGLSNGNGGQHYSDIDFAIYLRADSTLAVYEGGVLRKAGLGVYAPGDIFRVEVIAGHVEYRRNGILLYSSTAAPIFPLVVDTSFQTTGATINSVELSFSTTLYPVTALTDPEPPPNGFVETFGHSLARSGDTLVVARPGGYPPGTPPISAVYEYSRMGGTWTLASTIDMPSGNLPLAVAIDGDTLLVGCPSEHVAHVFVRGDTGWVLESSLVGDPGTFNFGTAVAVSGDTAVVVDQLTEGRGALYIFVRNGAIWTRQYKRKAPPPPSNSLSLYGQVSLIGDTLVVGNPIQQATANVPEYAGRVQILQRVAGVWSVAQNIISSDARLGDVGDWFGAFVAFDGTRIVAGSSRRPAAHVFAKTNGRWREEVKLVVNDSVAGFAVDGDLVAALLARGWTPIFAPVDGVWQVWRSASHYPEPAVGSDASAVSLDAEELITSARWGNWPSKEVDVYRVPLP